MLICKTAEFLLKMLPSDKMTIGKINDWKFFSLLQKLITIFMHLIRHNTCALRFMRSPQKFSNKLYVAIKAVVPKLGVNYPPRVICDFSGGTAKTTTYSQNHIVVLYYERSLQKNFDLKCEKFWLRVIRHNRYLDLGDGSKKFGNRWIKVLRLCEKLKPLQCFSNSLMGCNNQQDPQSLTWVGNLENWPLTQWILRVETSCSIFLQTSMGKYLSLDLFTGTTK